MGSFTPANYDNLIRMFDDLGKHKAEHPELYCHHWEMANALWGEILGLSEPKQSETWTLGGIKVEVNRYLPRDIILCVDVVNGERRIVKILKITNAEAQEKS